MFVTSLKENDCDQHSNWLLRSNEFLGFPYSLGIPTMLTERNETQLFHTAIGE